MRRTHNSCDLARTSKKSGVRSSNLFGRANPSPERVGVSQFARAFLCHMALFGFLSAGQWNVALKVVHSVVEDAYNFDRAFQRLKAAT